MTSKDTLKDEEMNTCEEYREAIAADPSFDGGAAHLSQCAPCQAFRSEILVLDRNIERALAITVPEFDVPELPDLDTSKVTALSTRRFATPAWLAVAATVTLAAFLGFRMLGDDLSSGTLAEQIISHIEHEPFSFRVNDKAVSDRRLARVVPATIATLDHDAGLITYAQSCTINGRVVPHLVIQGERGPVTILLMPDEKVLGAQSFGNDVIQGVILPVGNGSIAIVGGVGERLDGIQERVRNSVTWST